MIVDNQFVVTALLRAEWFNQKNTICLNVVTLVPCVCWFVWNSSRMAWAMWFCNNHTCISNMCYSAQWYQPCGIDLQVVSVLYGSSAHCWCTCILAVALLSMVVIWSMCKQTSVTCVATILLSLCNVIDYLFVSLYLLGCPVCCLTIKNHDMLSTTMLDLMNCW